MKYVVYLAQLIFGLFFVVSGVNFFLPYMTLPVGVTEIAYQFGVVMRESGLMNVVKIIEIVAGLGILFNRYVPLCLMACIPLSVVIFYWNIIDQNAFGIFMGTMVLFLNSFLMLAYFKYYKPMLVSHASSTEA